MYTKRIVLFIRNYLKFHQSYRTHKNTIHTDCKKNSPKATLISAVTCLPFQNAQIMVPNKYLHQPATTGI